MAKMTEEQFLNSFKANTPDITDEQAERLIQNTRENLKCYNSDDKKIEYLKKFSSFKNDDHSLSRWLTYYLKREMAFYNKDRTEPLESLPNLTVSQIQNEIIQNGTLDTFLKYKGFLPFSPKQLTGNMLLLFRLAEIYENLIPAKTQDSEIIQEQHTESATRKGNPLPFLSEDLKSTLFKDNDIIEDDLQKLKEAKVIEYENGEKPVIIQKEWNCYAAAICRFWFSNGQFFKNTDRTPWASMEHLFLFRHKGKTEKINTRKLSEKQKEDRFNDFCEKIGNILD